jgi:hypothetical protein
MNSTPTQLQRSLKKMCRRGFLASASALLVSAAQFLWRPLRYWAGSLQDKSPQAPGLSQGTLDLYAIFKDEIRTNYKDNVYVSLGNSLHLDGEAYVQASRALIAHDLVDIIRSSPMSEEVRQNLIKDQIVKTEAAFLNAVASLDWPKYSVELEDPEIKVSGPLHLSLYAHKNQFVIFVLRNSTGSPQTLHLASEEISLPVTALKIDSGSNRYVLGSAAAEQKGDWAIRVKCTTEKGSRSLVVVANIEETAILDGLLVTDELDAEPPMARIRVVDAKGKYFAPEVEPSGLIRMPTDAQTTRAERWFYADGNFQVRVPLGKIRVSIRRGLEYHSLDEEIEVKEGCTLQKKFVLSRWAHMEKDGWYPGDMHVHNLDPKTALFESRAECLNFVNVMVYKHLDYIGTREHFTGGVDPVSDDRHFIYFTEEFRNEPMGHLQLINLKQLVEPVATGRLGLHWPTIETYEDLSMPLPFHGDANSPDFPLLLQAMRETHQQGGLVGWAHLRPSEWEFPLDAAEGQIDFADIMTHTDIPQDLQLWYALLNCDFHIPACAGTDRQEPVGPMGHQRVYVCLDAPLSYANWIKALKAGNSFVTNGPMVQLHVDTIKPGGVIDFSEPTEVSISSSAFSQIPFERLEIIVNGEILRTGNATDKGLSAEITLNHTVSQSAWVVARCMGAWDKELFYSNPVFAHTNPVYVRYRKGRVAKPESAKFLLSFLRKLEDWAEREAYFQNSRQKKEVLRTIRSGMRYFERISLQSIPG